MVIIVYVQMKFLLSSPVLNVPHSYVFPLFLSVNLFNTRKRKNALSASSYFDSLLITFSLVKLVVSGQPILIGRLTISLWIKVYYIK